MTAKKGDGTATSMTEEAAEDGVGTADTSGGGATPFQTSTDPDPSTTDTTPPAASVNYEPTEDELAGLAVGRFVHYVLKTAEHRSAVVVRLFEHLGFGMCNLYVFLDGHNDRSPHALDLPEMTTGIVWATSVKFDPSGTKPHTWHWPERV